MLNKTIRSVLSLALVFCLLLGVSGNAIAMAVSNPIDGALETIDSKVESIITDLRNEIASLDAQVKEQQKTLDKAEEELDKANEELFEAQQELDAAKKDLELAPDSEAKDDALADIAAAEAEIIAAQKQVAEATALVANAEATLAQAEDTIAQATVAVDNVEKTYNDLRVAIENPEPSLSYVKDTVKELETNVVNLWDSIKTLQTSVDELIVAYSALEAAEMEEVPVPEMPEELTKLDETLDKVIATVTSLSETLRYYVEAAKPIVAKALDMTVEALGITYDVLKNNLNKETLVKVYNWLYNNPDKVCAVVKELGVYGLELMVHYGPYALELVNDHFDLVVLGMKLTATGACITATLGAKALGYVGDHLDFLFDYKDEVVDAARKLYAKYGDEAKALVEVYVEYLELEERYYNATHTQLTICCGTKYVAIGDTVFADNSYSQQLAADLYLKNYKGVYAADVEMAVGLVEGNADIANADLITLGFGNMTAINAMVEQLLGDGSFDPDWAVFDNQDIDDIVFKSLAELETELVAKGLNAKNVAVVLDAAEAFAYAYLKQQVNYIRLVNEIQTVNPDVKIVIVGSYNELKDMSIVLGGHTINVGKYMFPMVCASNLQALAEGFLNENVIYVDAHEVEMNNGGGQFNLNEVDGQGDILFTITGEDLLPNANGHAYIAEQIANALNVEYVMWGDVNGDHLVNCRDARLILQYAAGIITEEDLDLTWGDVNGDGKVNSRDARLVLQMRAGQIEHFPVCELA